MLNIFYGRGSQDLPALMYSEIKRRLKLIRTGRTAAKHVLVVVPAQSTMKAEEDAFRLLGGSGFFDLHIVSGNKLRMDILRETGSTGKTAVNSLGRSMLLRKIAREHAGELQAYRAVAEDPAFLSMAGDFIVQMKQNGLTADDVARLRDETERESLLRDKLADMAVFSRAYAQVMEGKYTDSEDLLRLTGEKVAQSVWIRDAEIFYYDFYSFTKNELAFRGALEEHARSLNMVFMMGSPDDPDAALFGLTRRAAASLASRAREAGHKVAFYEADPSANAFTLPRAESLKKLEQQLFCPQHASAFQQEPEDFAHAQEESFSAAAEGLHLVRCSTPFTQGESIAVEILRLVREKGCKLNEIAVLCSDMKGQGNAIKRALAASDIPVFVDEKRAVMHTPAARTLAALLDIAAYGARASDVLRFIKPGLVTLGFSAAGAGDRRGDLTAACEFENYVKQYHINGSRFFQPFRYGRTKLGEERFLKLEAVRRQLAGLLGPFMDHFVAAATVREKSEVLYRFLTEELFMPDMLSEISASLAKDGYADAAEECRQIFDVFIGLLDQMVELMGSETLSAEDYAQLVETAFSDIKVGLLPQAEGRVLLGSMGRTRTDHVRALFIAGVNDGLLPADPEADGILSEREIELLAGRGTTLAKSSSVLAEEERFNIYRALCMPSEYLWLGYCLADGEGNDLRPSYLLTELAEIFPELKTESDVENSDRPEDLIVSRSLAASSFASTLRDHAGEDYPDIWKAAFNTMRSRRAPQMAALAEGLTFSLERKRLTQRDTRELFAKDGSYSFSPSRLEKFAQCPFRHFVTYGLKPEEPRDFEISFIELGDIYHEALMRICEQLSMPARMRGIALSDPRSPWMTVTQKELMTMTVRILDEMADSSLDGIMKAGKAEIYRSRRVKEVCLRFAWQMVLQLRRGRIRDMYFEMPFGQGKPLPPLIVGSGAGRVRIEGKIDRIDLLPVDGEEYVKIIDYKSGAVSFDRAKVEKGLSLQLMVYLEGALGGRKGAKPAGVFYYSIKNPDCAASLRALTAGEIADDLVKRITKEYMLDGIAVSDERVLGAIDTAIEAGGSSTVIDAERGKEGSFKSKNLISSEEFEKLREDFARTLEEICSQLTGGEIAASPRGSGGRNGACGYCDYRSICCFYPDIASDEMQP